MHFDRMCLQQNASQMLRGNTVPSPWGNLSSINSNSNSNSKFINVDNTLSHTAILQVCHLTIT